MSRTARLSVAALALLAVAADPPMKTVRVKGLTFDVPASWKSSPASSQFRLAQLRAEPSEGDKEPAELVLFAFGGGAGGVEANLKRWQEQFQDDQGRPPKIQTEKRKGRNVEVTVAEVAGRYVAAVQPGASKTYNKPGYRLLGAIVQTDRAAFFFKMVGPEKTMKDAKPGFDAMVKSIATTDE